VLFGSAETVKSDHRYCRLQGNALSKEYRLICLRREVALFPLPP
jgi:hypothetical protein